MGKLDSKRLNVRLKDAAAKRLGEMAAAGNCSQTVVLERLILGGDVTIAAGNPEWAREDAMCRDSQCQFEIACASQREELADTLKRLVACQESRLAGTSSQVPSTLIGRQGSGVVGAGVGVSRQAAVSGDGYEATCSHCGTGFKIPAGRPPSTLCGECFLIGHRNDPNCYECRKAEHLAKLRSEDKTGGDREDIDRGFNFGA